MEIRPIRPVAGKNKSVAVKPAMGRAVPSVKRASTASFNRVTSALGGATCGMLGKRSIGPTSSSRSTAPAPGAVLPDCGSFDVEKCGCRGVKPLRGPADRKRFRRGMESWHPGRFSKVELWPNVRLQRNRRIKMNWPGDQSNLLWRVVHAPEATGKARSRLQGQCLDTSLAGSGRQMSPGSVSGAPAYFTFSTALSWT